jgi:hypothetical protein
MFNSPPKIAAWSVVGLLIVGIIGAKFVKIK